MKGKGTKKIKNLPEQKTIDKRVKSGVWLDFKAVKLDGRTKLAQALRNMKAALAKHVGGEPSIAETILIDRITHKVVKAYIYETNYFSSPELGSKDHYLALVNSLRLDLQALGLNQKEKKILDLTEYLRKKQSREENKNFSRTAF